MDNFGWLLLNQVLNILFNNGQSPADPRLICTDPTAVC